MRNSWWSRTPGWSRQALPALPVHLEVLRSDEVEDVGPDEIVARMSPDGRGGRAGVEERPVAREKAHGVRTVLDDRAEQTLASLQRLLRAAAVGDVEDEGDRLRWLEQGRADQHARAGSVPSHVFLLAGMRRARAPQLLHDLHRQRHPLRRRERIPAHVARADVLARVAQHLQEGVVGLENAAVGVGDDDAQHPGVEQAREAQLQPAQGRLALRDQLLLRRRVSGASQADHATEEAVAGREQPGHSRGIARARLDDQGDGVPLGEDHEVRPLVQAQALAGDLRGACLDERGEGSKVSALEGCRGDRRHRRCFSRRLLEQVGRGGGRPCRLGRHRREDLRVVRLIDRPERPERFELTGVEPDSHAGPPMLLQSSPPVQTIPGACVGCNIAGTPCGPSPRFSARSRFSHPSCCRRARRPLRRAPAPLRSVAARR
jgi:hypothetical protein